MIWLQIAIGFRISDKKKMKALVLVKKLLILALVATFLVWVFVFNWSFVFKRKIVGEVVSAQRVEVPVAVMTTPNGALPPQVFSFSVAIKDRESGEIHMASSEDRQWAAVEKGNCVVAAYFPYPPWRLDKGNTNSNARLLRNFVNCEKLPSQDGWLESLKFFFLLN